MEEMPEMADREELAHQLELEEPAGMLARAESVLWAELNMSEVFWAITLARSQLSIQLAPFLLPEQMAAQRAMEEMPATEETEGRLARVEMEATKARLLMLETAQHCMSAALSDITLLPEWFQTLGLQAALQQRGEMAELLASEDCPAMEEMEERLQEEMAVRVSQVALEVSEAQALPADLSAQTLRPDLSIIAMLRRL